MFSDESKGWEPEMTFTFEIEIVMIHKNHILFLTDLTYFLIVKNSIKCPGGNRGGRSLTF